MNLLTFLGTADYKQTTYTLAGQGYTTCYCPAAVAYFCRPETTLVVVTKDARAKHFEPLADEIASFTQPVAVPIPDGHSEADLWQIFDALTRQVEAEAELVVDITNGFRSLPFLSFLAVAFLRLARRVKVERIYYGAWEARNQAANESPIFDLTPFVTLLDWTIATDRFTRFGDASDLAALLRQGIPPGSQMSRDLPARALGNALKRAATAMEGVSLALRLTRPLETMTASANLAATWQQVGALVEQQAPPFGLLAAAVRQTYQPLAMAQDPLERANWRLNLQIQLDLVGLYLKRGQVVQAVTLAREWLVSLLVYAFAGASLVDYEQGREPVERALNNEVERRKPNPRALLETPYDEALQKLPNARELGQLWNKLTQLRNDLAHVGMNLNPKPAEKLARDAHELYPRLQEVGRLLLANHEGGHEPDRPSPRMKIRATHYALWTTQYAKGF